MRAFDPQELLVSVHIPKCAGTSFIGWLRAAFDGRLHLHYPDLAPPEKLSHRAGWCVHGHFFHHAWPIGANDYYPDARQYITVLRDPLQMVISSYFFMAHKGERLAPTLQAYLDEVLTQWPRLTQFAGMPAAPDADDTWGWMNERFVWVGVVEALDICLPVLAGRLGVRAAPMPLENTAPRDQVLADPRGWEARFRDKFAWEYGLYDKALAGARSAC